MDKNSELDCYLYYMWNVWGYEECVAHFSEHIWSKWVEAANNCGSVGAPAKLYAELDEKNRKKIVALAVKHYNDGVSLSSLERFIKGEYSIALNTMVERIETRGWKDIDEFDDLVKEYGEILTDHIKENPDFSNYSMHDLRKAVEGAICDKWHETVGKVKKQ